MTKPCLPKPKPKFSTKKMLHQVGSNHELFVWPSFNSRCHLLSYSLNIEFSISETNSKDIQIFHGNDYDVHSHLIVFLA